MRAARFGDLFGARAVFLAGSAAHVEIRQADDAVAGGAFAELVLHLAPGLFKLGGGHLQGVLGIIAQHAIGDGAAEQRHLAQQAAHSLPPDVLGDCTAHIRLAAEFTAAHIAVENGVDARAIVADVIGIRVKAVIALLCL